MVDGITSTNHGKRYAGAVAGMLSMSMHVTVSLRRPVSAFVKDVENLHRVGAEPIRDDVGCFGDDQLKRVGLTARFPEIRKIGKLADLLLNLLVYAKGCQHIALGDVVDDFVFLNAGFRQPDD